MLLQSVNENGDEIRVLNKKETMLASQKQDAMKAAFKDWIFKDQQRRERLVRVYNERFNSIRPREYDGSHLTFPGMNPEIELRPHQKNAVAHQLYGDNVLLAHVVGAGKTYEMVAAAMESKRLGLSQKNLFVVVLKPTEQQKEIVASLGERAEVVRNGGVDASVDNMLKITNDGRKLALDQRLVNELLPDDPGSKVSVCAEKSYEIWKDTAAQKSTQIIFCDLSTPKGDGSFNVYDDLKQKLIAKGVPKKEIR